MIIDIILGIYFFIGMVKGYRRKLSIVWYKSIRNVTASVSGLTMFQSIGDLLGEISSFLFSPILAFLIGLGGSFFVIRLLKKKMIGWIEQKVGEASHSLKGAMVGLTANTVMGVSLVFMTCLTGSGFLYRIVAKGSTLGRFCNDIIHHLQ